MAITIKKTGRSEYGQYIKALIYGAPGAGKTLFGSTAKDCLFINLEAGLMTLHSRGVDYTDAQSPEDLHEILIHLRQPSHGYKTVVIDTLDELQKVLIASRLKKERKEQMTLQDWGFVGEQMQKVLRAYRNLPMNVIFLCHSSTEVDSENGGMAEKPALQGAVKDQVAGFVDLAAHIQATTVKEGDKQGEIVRVLRFQPSTRYPHVKDRSGKLPGFYKLNLETDFQDIYDLIYGDTTSIAESEERTVVVHAPVATEAPEATVPDDVPPPPTRGRTAKRVAVEEELKEESPKLTSAHGPVTKTVKVVPAVERETEDAKALVTKVLGGTEVTQSTPTFQCKECGTEVDEDLADLSKIRHRKVLCKTHFAAAKK